VVEGPGGVHRALCVSLSWGQMLLSPAMPYGPGSVLRVTFSHPGASEMTLRCTVERAYEAVHPAGRIAGQWLRIDGPELDTDDLISAARRQRA
jgi:hypothetical protein